MVEPCPSESFTVTLGYLSLWKVPMAGELSEIPRPGLRDCAGGQAHAHGAYCYPAVRPYHQAMQHGSVAMYRATAASYLSKGADALYMMQLCWPSCVAVRM